jgi:dienelactone hydrolase
VTVKDASPGTASPGTASPDPDPDPTAAAGSDITIGAPPWELPGTIDLPAAERPVPGVVIVHGSGPQDRDGTIGPNTPYRDLAEALVAAGIAVLRYDKRTLVHRARMADVAATFTVDDEVVDDALAAIGSLRATPAVDPDAVFVLGHSLGGYLGPRIVARSPEVRGLIVFSGNTRSLPEVILDQTEFLASRSGAPSPEAATAIATLRRQVAVVRSADLTPETPASDLPFGVPAAYWLDLRGYDPVATTAGLHRPVLVLQGGRDYQVTAADFEGWRRAAASRQGVTLRWLPELNHLGIAGDTPAGPADYAVAGHVSETLAGAIAGWVLETAGRG